MSDPNYNFRLPEDQVLKARKMGIDLPGEFRKLLAKLTKTKTCPTCKRAIRSRK